MATYRHFANRQALLDELARREFAQLATDPAASWTAIRTESARQWMPT